MLTTGAANGILTNEVNVGFTPEGKYLTAGNDVVDLSKWDGKISVTIGDAFSNDNDKVAVMASSLAGTNSNLKLTSIENLEIINAKETKALNLVGENFKGLESIKLKGDATTLNVSGFTYGVKIDATENADNIFGGTKADTINGGAGNDIIKAGSGNDVLTGGNGADTFIVGSVQSLGIDQILDFSAEDKISMTGFTVGNLKKFDASTFSTVNYKTLDSVLATFGPGGANVTKAGDVVIFSYDGKTYALLANGAFDERTDALVDITGANVESLTESNFGEASLYTYENYAAFTSAITNGVQIPDGEAVIKTMTVENAQELAVDNNLLAKIAAGGIKAITGDGPITVAVPVNGGVGEFDARIFDSKLGADVVDVTLNINGSANTDIIYASKLGGTINGSGGNDRIDASNATGAVTIEGGSGADVITLGAGADVVKYSKAGETAVINSGSETAKASIVSEVKKVAQGADIINNVKVGDKITLNTAASITQLVAHSSGKVVDSNTFTTAGLNATSNNGDVFVLKDGNDYFLVYEASGSGTAGNLGTNAEVIKLVGFTDNNTITVDGTTITIV